MIPYQKVQCMHLISIILYFNLINLYFNFIFCICSYFFIFYFIIGIFI